MTGLIVIDESGDTGRKEGSSRFFVMAGIITKRSRNLLKAYNAAPRSDGPEIKLYHADSKERLKVIREVGRADIKIAYVCVDKHNTLGIKERGNALYRIVLEDLLRNCMELSDSRDLNIYVDDSPFIKINQLENIVDRLSNITNKNVKNCKKVSSDKCVRIADYIAGSISRKYERGDLTLFEIIENKIEYPSPVNHLGHANPQPVSRDLSG